MSTRYEGQEALPSAERIRELLKLTVLEVTFTKRDGTDRVMFCTLLPQYLPEYEDRETQEPDPNIITVWDLEANAWRCFRLDTVKVIEYD